MWCGVGREAGERAAGDRSARRAGLCRLMCEGEGAGWARGRAHYLNMPTKLVTLDVSKLTDWLNAFAT